MLDFSVTFLITIVNVTFLYLVMRKLLFKPVTQFMENRSNKIQKDIDHAKIATARAAALEAEYAAKLQASRDEGQRIMQMARERAEQERASILAEAKAEAERILSAGRERIEQEKREAERKLLGETADMSIRAATAVLGENIDSSKNRALVEKFLASMGAA